MNSSDERIIVATYGEQFNESKTSIALENLYKELVDFVADQPIPPEFVDRGFTVFRTDSGDIEGKFLRMPFISNFSYEWKSYETPVGLAYDLRGRVEFLKITESTDTISKPISLCSFSISPSGDFRFQTRPDEPYNVKTTYAESLMKQLCKHISFGIIEQIPLAA